MATKFNPFCFGQIELCIGKVERREREKEKEKKTNKKEKQQMSLK